MHVDKHESKSILTWEISCAVHAAMFILFVLLISLVIVRGSFNYPSFIDKIPILSGFLFVIPAILFFVKAQNESRDIYTILAFVLFFLAITSFFNHCRTYSTLQKNNTTCKSLLYPPDYLNILDVTLVLTSIVLVLLTPEWLYALPPILYALVIMIIIRKKISSPTLKSLLHASIHFYAVLAYSILAISTPPPRTHDPKSE